MATVVVITYDPLTVPLGSTLRLYRRADSAQIDEDKIADGTGIATFTAPNAVLRFMQLMAYDGPDNNIDVTPLAVALS